MKFRAPITEITVPFGRRSLRDVEALAQSIKEVGLLNPITVTPDLTLIAGYHRLEACKRLGWKDIPVQIMKLDGLKAELAEIDENLVRNELTVLEHAEALKRRKEIYEALHPKSKKGGSRGNQHTGGGVMERVLKKRSWSIGGSAPWGYAQASPAALSPVLRKAAQGSTAGERA